MRIHFLEQTGGNLRFLAAILRNSELVPGRTALEIGCGTGILAESLEAVTGARILGTEKSYEAFRTASHRISARYCPDGSIPSSGMFDLVYCKDVLPMIEDKPHFFVQVRRILRSGSPFITYLPEEADFNQKPLFVFFPECVGPSINRHEGYEEIKVNLLRAGFQECVCQRIYLGQVSFDGAYVRKHQDGMFNNTDSGSLDAVREKRLKDLDTFTSNLAKYGAKASYSWERLLIVAK